MQSLCLASCHCLLIHHHIFTSRLRKFNLSKTKLPKSTHQNLFFNWATCHNSSTSEEAGGLEFKDNFTSSRSYFRSGLLSHTFDPSLDYRWSARTARATQESPVLALYTFMSFPTVLSAQFHSRCTNHPFLFPFLTSLTLCNPASASRVLGLQTPASLLSSTVLDFGPFPKCYKASLMLYLCFLQTLAQMSPS